MYDDDAGGGGGNRIMFYDKLRHCLCHGKRVKCILWGIAHAVNIHNLWWWYDHGDI